MSLPLVPKLLLNSCLGTHLRETPFPAPSTTAQAKPTGVGPQIAQARNGERHVICKPFTDGRKSFCLINRRIVRFCHYKERSGPPAGCSAKEFAGINNRGERPKVTRPLRRVAGST